MRYRCECSVLHDGENPGHSYASALPDEQIKTKKRYVANGQPQKFGVNMCVRYDCECNAMGKSGSNTKRECSKWPKVYLCKIWGENVRFGVRYGCKCNVVCDGEIRWKSNNF